MEFYKTRQLANTRIDVADVLAWLLSGKMYGIFAMLFGLSFFIMNDNQQQKGKNFSGRFAWRMFYNEGRNLQIWHQLLWRSALVVAVLSYIDFGELETWFKPIYNLTILIMIVSAIVSAWYASEGVRKVLHHLCIFGRMSLTNYLLQSIIGSFIFCGYGLACYRWLGITYAVMIGVGMVMVQYLFCRWWFSNHQRGPLEGLWRKLTWL